MKLENIDKSIQKQDILQGISLEVSPQKLTAFIGPNGAGKSTLLSIMSRLTKKDQGVLSIKGREIESWNSQELAQELTILKQKINYQAKLTVEELVSFGRFPYSRGRLRSEDWEKIRETLNYLELTNLKDRYINSLSGGQLQRVFIAMVLAQDTDFILLDEPLTLVSSIGYIFFSNFQSTFLLYFNFKIGFFKSLFIRSAYTTWSTTSDIVVILCPASLEDAPQWYILCLSVFQSMIIYLSWNSPPDF